MSFRDKTKKFWDNITGNDLTRSMLDFRQRYLELPKDYQEIYDELDISLWQYSDITGRNLVSIHDDILTFFEESVQNGKSVSEVMDEDINEFCKAIAQDESLKSYRDKLRLKLNKNVHKKLGKLE